MAKLQWKRRRDGSEVAGPFVVQRSGWGQSSDLYVNSAFHREGKTRAAAKRAAQRLADEIIKNMVEGK